jgi:hypothetical protein
MSGFTHGSDRSISSTPGCVISPPGLLPAVVLLVGVVEGVLVVGVFLVHPKRDSIISAARKNTTLFFM